jgi:FkbM family methyltransferase
MGRPLRSLALDLVKRASTLRHTVRPVNVPASAWSTAPTDTDVDALYRLLLEREVDPEAAAGYRVAAAQGSLTFGQLLSQVATSPEYLRKRTERRQAAHEPVEVDLGDYVMWVDPADFAVGATIADRRDYEPEVTAVVRSLLRPGDTFVDVGANMGWYALVAAGLVGPAGHVIAVEPNGTNTALLRRSAEANDFTQVRIVEAAATDEFGWLALETDGSNGRIIRLGPLDAATRPIPCSFAVPAVSVDDLVGGADGTGVAAIKVDVEGLETRVFEGARRLLERDHPAVVFEWFPRVLRDNGEVDPLDPVRFLRRFGYELRVIGGPEDPVADADLERIRLEHGRDMLDLLATAQTAP